MYKRPQSRREELTHLVRGAMVPAIFAVLLLGRPQGTLFWIVAALLVIDTMNSLIDVMIEPASRAPIGVPPAELAIHFIGTTMMGGALAIYLITGWPTRNAPSALVPWPAGTFPTWLPQMAWGALATGVVLVLFEASLVVRYARRPAAA
ncbi:MAG TPA: hypothetical protein VF618_22460 [Thermoanaerobaculia bacterium]